MSGDSKENKAIKAHKK